MNPPELGGATEPITLTDPDGAVTRVAPWSSWIREQVRAPGGEPALITRLDQGQLWFSAGRRRSPWRHEVHVGPAVISTPRGRFHAVAEPDGGATVSCLAGRTRVVSGLWAPVLLSPDQTAAISSDGRTLVVMDQTNESVIEVEPVVIDLTNAEVSDEELDEELAPVGVALGRNGVSPSEPPAEAASGPTSRPPADSAEVGPSRTDVPHDRRPARLGWIPELVAVAALLALLVAAVWVFTTEAEAAQTTRRTPSSAEASAPATARRPASASSAAGTLEGCVRRGSVVEVTVAVEHRSGPPSAFEVTASLVDDAGSPTATGRATTAVVAPGATADVTVPIEGRGVQGATCELVRVGSV